MKREIIILHDYGASDHYTALRTVKSAGVIKEFEFTITRKLIHGLVKFDLKKVKKSLVNFIWIMSSLLNPKINSGKNIILGIAPFDWRILYIKRVVKYSNVVLHTSWTSWNDDFHPKKNKLFSDYYKEEWRRFIKNGVSFVAAVTAEVKKEISIFCNDSQIENKIHCVYHCIHDIPLKKNKRDNENKLKVIYAGNIIQQKGILIILQLCMLYPDVQFTFIGKGPLVSEIKKRDLTNVTFLGYISDKQRLYSEFSDNDIFLLPSLKKRKWEELFGIALVEAMYNGCIPLTTNHTGPREIMHDSFLAKNIFEEELYIEGVSSFISKITKDPCLIPIYKKEACRVSQNFTASNLGKVWEKMLI